MERREVEVEVEAEGLDKKKEKKKMRKRALFNVPMSRKRKLKRLERKQQRRLSRVQSGVEGSHGQMLVGPESHLVKCAKSVSRVQSGINDTGKYQWSHRLNKIFSSQDLQFAKTALEYYEKSQGGDFEIVEALYSKRAIISNVELKSNEEVWVHVSFIAKPKNAECGDVSPKHFFGELFQSDQPAKWEATYCSTFEPRNDPGFDHGCVFCPPVLKCHPPDGYCVGNGNWYKPRHACNWYYGPRPKASSRNKIGSFTVTDHKTYV